MFLIIYDYNIGSVRKNISYINQNTKLFNASVYENILYGNHKKDKSYIDNLIKEMKLETVYKNLENGFETNVGVDGDKLSGGQKQITFLLRELIAELVFALPKYFGNLHKTYLKT